MKILHDIILKDGLALSDSILKVDSFVNHQIDPKLMNQVGKEFVKRFQGVKIDKVLTIEASGIAPAMITALELGVPMVFAKKHKPITMDKFYSTTVYSFTKQTNYNLTVSKEFIHEGENILLIDDFLSAGNAILGLKDIVNQGGANIVGVGIVIEKGFKEGRTNLLKEGFRLESLAIVEKMEKGKITLNEIK
ncbi:MAG: xanthine phosphoribosyltransferase [Psychrilyobacter sp.]|uniref:xanthine phosphoribosyltransferase n=1 Tax=Psychrilyobacter sp. TaxID=2586924 RepID=UPI003C7696B2